MSGTFALILTGLGLSTNIPAAKAFLVAGLICFFLSTFFVWRKEYAKNREPYSLAQKRRADFAKAIEDLEVGEGFEGHLAQTLDGSSEALKALMRLAVDGTSDMTEGIRYLLDHMAFAIEYDQSTKKAQVRDRYLPLVREWADGRLNSGLSDAKTKLRAIPFARSTDKSLAEEADPTKRP